MEKLYNFIQVYVMSVIIVKSCCNYILKYRLVWIEIYSNLRIGTCSFLWLILACLTSSNKWQFKTNNASKSLLQTCCTTPNYGVLGTTKECPRLWEWLSTNRHVLVYPNTLLMCLSASRSLCSSGCRWLLCDGNCFSFLFELFLVWMLSFHIFPLGGLL